MDITITAGNESQDVQPVVQAAEYFFCRNDLVLFFFMFLNVLPRQKACIKDIGIILENLSR